MGSVFLPCQSLLKLFLEDQFLTFAEDKQLKPQIKDKEGTKLYQKLHG